MKLLLTAALCALAAPTVLATVNGRCSGDFNDGTCICVTKTACNKFANALVEPGSKADGYPCPYDPPEVQGCYVSPCKGKDIYTDCAFTDECKKNGKPISGNLCPGGTNFICCNFR